MTITTIHHPLAPSLARMDFADANPLASCTAGGNGRKVIMVSYHSLPEDVQPIFQIHVGGSHRPDLDQFLVQPTKENFNPSSVIQFSTPAQPNLNQINQNFTVKLTAQDSAGRVSNNKWDFQYAQHEEREADGQGNCQGRGQGRVQGNGQGQRECIFCRADLDV